MKRYKIRFAATACVLFLLLAFIGSAVAVVLLGTQSESAEQSFSAQTFGKRTLMSFLSEKLRQGDGAGDIYVGEFDGTNALFIESTLQGALYTDIIYGYEGFLCELLCEKSADFSHKDGTKLIEVGSVSFSEPESGLIYIEVTDTEGKTSFLHMFLKSGGQL